MVIGVPREVPRQKPKGPQAPTVLAFPHIFIHLSSRTSKEGFLSSVPGSIMVKIQGMDFQYW